MGTIHPNLLSTKERLEEVASILALGIVRLWKRQKSSNCLDLEGFSRMYAKDGNKEEKPYEEQCVRKDNRAAENAAG